MGQNISHSNSTGMQCLLCRALFSLLRVNPWGGYQIIATSQMRKTRHLPTAREREIQMPPGAVL